MKSKNQPQPKRIPRNKTLYTAVTTEQFEQFAILSEMMKENKSCRFLYRVIDKLLKENKDAIEQYKESTSSIKW